MPADHGAHGQQHERNGDDGRGGDVRHTAHCGIDERCARRLKQQNARKVNSAIGMAARFLYTGTRMRGMDRQPPRPMDPMEGNQMRVIFN